MGNSKSDLLGTLSNLLSNIDINQVMSLVSSFMSQRPEKSNKSSNPASFLGNFDLGKLSEALTNFSLGDQNLNDRKPSFFNLGNQTQGYNGIFNGGNLQSLFSSVTSQLESLRKLRF